MTCNINPHINRWIEMIESGEIEACDEQILLCKMVKDCFETEDIYTDDQQLEKYLGLTKYFSYECLFEWEAFCIALHLCTFWKKDDRPRWPDLFLLIGRGAGKDGFIALESICLISPYSKLLRYDVDICANAEEQAMRPVNDVLEVLENPQHRSKLKKFFYWTKEQVTGLKTKAVLRGRTNNPKSKDGMRSGIVIFNEIHQYLNYDNIKVFITGLGKKKHPRRLYATTNGDVREGPLDDILAQSEQILKGEISDNGLLPFICRLNKKEDAHDKTKWVQANPSLIHLPDLMVTIEKEYNDWVKNPVANADFMTKRMNLPQSASELPVTEWANIISTFKKKNEISKLEETRIIPDLIGRPCVGALDYALITDFASANLHFRDGNIRYDINHSWLCLQSKDLHRLKIPWREWAELGYITLVEDKQINPGLLTDWFAQHAQKYEIRMMALDNNRYTLVSDSLRGIGFDKDNKNLKLVRPSDIMRVVPVIDSIFTDQNFIWGDAPVLRWATNNTKLVRASRNIGSDTGNFYYAKIEAKSRKTDPFMAVAHSMVIEDELGSGASVFDNLPVITC